MGTLYLKFAKSGKKGMPSWYSLFDGPRSIRQLAYYLKLGATYDILYSGWSESVHAGGAMLTVAGRDSTILGCLAPERAQLVTTLAVSFTSQITRAMFGRYSPDRVKDWQEWYASIRSFFVEIYSRQILKVV